MATEKTMDTPRSKTRLIVAIDYGTTYSGLAWIETDGEKEFSTDDVHIFRAWPKQEEVKVPSKISYSDAVGERGCRQWGYDIEKDSNVLQWTKLELATRSTLEELETLRDLVKGNESIQRYCTHNDPYDTSRRVDQHLHVCKTSEEIMHDYVKRMAGHWWESMTTQSHVIFERVAMDMVISHPAEWPYEALNKTVRAIKRAFTPGRFPSFQNGDIYLTSEPEAAASSIIEDLNARDISFRTLIEGQCFVVCDAGGGTVDLAAYYIEAKDPLKVTQIGKPSSGKFGATFIDREFLRWLQPKVRGLNLLTEDHTTGGHTMVTPDAVDILERFERWKHAYAGREEEEVVIPLPRSVTLTDESGDGLESGAITLRNEDMRAIFKHSVSGTLNLIDKKIMNVKRKKRNGINYEVSDIFLSGGFAQNPFLVNEVTRWAKAKNIKVQKAEGLNKSNGGKLDDLCWSGVVRGAVIQGFGRGISGLTRIYTCPRSYGICISQISDYRHLDQDTVEDEFHGGQMVRDQAVWLIKKDDVLPPSGDPLSEYYTVNFRLSNKDLANPRELQVVFVASSDDDPPTNLKDLPPSKRELQYLPILISQIPPNFLKKQRRAKATSVFDKDYWIAEMRVMITVRKVVTVSVHCGENLMVSRNFNLSGP